MRRQRSAVLLVDLKMYLSTVSAVKCGKQTTEPPLPVTETSNQCFLFLQGYILIFVTFINSAGGGMDKERESSTKEKFGSFVPV